VDCRGQRLPRRDRRRHEHSGRRPFGFRSTRDAAAVIIEAGSANIRAQIEADRRNRIWEKQAAAYEDVVRELLDRRTRREVLLGLTWADADLDSGVLTIQRTLLELGGKLTEGTPRTRAGERGSTSVRRPSGCSGRTGMPSRPASAPAGATTPA
jgi:hypothetical protein